VAAKNIFQGNYIFKVSINVFLFEQFDFLGDSKLEICFSQNFEGVALLPSNIQNY
jgi:hypothetical protein